jgi:hypothetical protein
MPQQPQQPQHEQHTQHENGKYQHVPAAAVQSALKGAHYPATKDDLIRLAQQNNAPSPLIEKIRDLPGSKFGGPQDVMKAFGQEQ